MIILKFENDVNITIHNEALECASFDGVRQQIVLTHSNGFLEKKFKQYYYAPFINIALIDKVLNPTDLNQIMELKLRRIIIEEDNDAKEFILRLCDIDKKQINGLTIITIKGRAI